MVLFGSAFPARQLFTASTDYVVLRLVCMARNNSHAVHGSSLIEDRPPSIPAAAICFPAIMEAISASNQTTWRYPLHYSDGAGFDSVNVAVA